MNQTAQIRTDTCKVVAPSSREALRLLREKLGPNAMVLSNRVTAEGIEIIAAVEMPDARLAEPLPLPPPIAPPAPPSLPAAENQSSSGLGDGAGSVLREIHSMRGMIEEQLAGMAWNERQRRDPVRGQLLRTMLGAGFSARLAKDILEHLPIGESYSRGMEYVRGELIRQMPVLNNEDALMDGGGVYALMGPTGVGKTTTTAKLAARCVMRFGAEKLALVTTDSYRIGAYEQLRIYGQILGVSVHAVKDAADLERVLEDLRDKHMVLVDTVGMSQRDHAVSEQIAMLCDASRPVQRLLLLNASSHGDTLNEVVQAYRHSGQKAGRTDLVGCIFTKVDEATHPGVLVDMAIRHRLPVHYISSGQKVPEHLMLADGKALIDSVFQARSSSALFVPGDVELAEQPISPVMGAEVAAAEAVSERLRSQCQQLIRALTHNAQELASNASALAGGQIGFEETHALWRKLPDDQVGPDAIAQALHFQASKDSRASCHEYVLALAGETGLVDERGAETGILASTLLLSDRTGQPIAASQQFLAGASHPGLPSSLAGAARKKLDKPVVRLLGSLPASRLLDQWQTSGILWAASATAALRIVDAEKGTPGTLAKLAATLAYGEPQPAIFRKKPALVFVAEALVFLRTDPKDTSVGPQAGSTAPLRCVVRRVVDADTGKPLAHSYVLVSTDVRSTTQQIAQWPSWRKAADPYFKLLGQGVRQIDSGAAPDDMALHKRLLVAGQVSLTVFRLQQAQAAWADTARKVLAQLAGRTVRPKCPIPGPVLLEGLGKFFVLLDALQNDGEGPSPHRHLAAAQG